MAFGFNNSQKSAKGVEKGEYTPRFTLYWEIIFRKIWLFIKANFAYVITSIPAFLFIWFGGNYFAQGTLGTLKSATFLTIATVYISVVGIGFIIPGITFLTRYFAKQRHVWIFSDFYEQIAANFKKGFILFLFDTVLLYLSTVAFGLYGELVSTNKFMLIPLGFMSMCLIVYFMMHFYMYPIMVTFDLDLKYILKDSLLLTLAHLPWNLLITFIITSFTFALYVFNIPITAIIMLVVGIAFINFTVNYMVDPIIDKHLYIPAEVLAEKENTEN